MTNETKPKQSIEESSQQIETFLAAHNIGRKITANLVEIKMNDFQNTGNEQDFYAAKDQEEQLVDREDEGTRHFQQNAEAYFDLAKQEDVHRTAASGTTN